MSRRLNVKSETIEPATGRQLEALSLTHTRAKEAKFTVFAAQDAAGELEGKHGENVRELLALARSALEGVDRELVNMRDGHPAAAHKYSYAWPKKARRSR